MVKETFSQLYGRDCGNHRNRYDFRIANSKKCQSFSVKVDNAPVLRLFVKFPRDLGSMVQSPWPI